MNGANVDLVKNVLLVDDDEFTRSLVGAICRKSPHNVVIVGSGIEALQKIADMNFNIMFIDMELPDIQGPELVRKIKEKIMTDIPIYAFTAHTEESILQTMKTAGCTGYFLKPLNREKFFQMIAEC